MTIRLMSLAVLVATVAAISVWLLTVATFDPAAYVETRSPCSGGMFIGAPEATWPPHCRQAPVPVVALSPFPWVAAIATFLIVGMVGLSVVQALRRRE